MSQKSVRGKTGEEHVCEYLSGLGWRIAERNYRIRGGEIDIIAEDDATIAFVEVKTRKSGSAFNGLEAMTKQKMRCIFRTAEHYLQKKPESGKLVRFDLALVDVTTEDIPRVLDMEYMENAFDSSYLEFDTYLTY